MLSLALVEMGTAVIEMGVFEALSSEGQGHTDGGYGPSDPKNAPFRASLSAAAPAFQRERARSQITSRPIRRCPRPPAHSPARSVREHTPAAPVTRPVICPEADTRLSSRTHKHTQASAQTHTQTHTGHCFPGPSNAFICSLAQDTEQILRLESQLHTPPPRNLSHPVPASPSLSPSPSLPRSSDPHTRPRSLTAEQLHSIPFYLQLNRRLEMVSQI